MTGRDLHSLAYRLVELPDFDDARYFARVGNEHPCCMRPNKDIGSIAGP
jgi:hypothetical protein